MYVCILCVRVCMCDALCVLCILFVYTNERINGCMSACVRSECMNVCVCFLRVFTVCYACVRNGCMYVFAVCVFRCCACSLRVVLCGTVCVYVCVVYGVRTCS